MQTVLSAVPGQLPSHNHPHLAHANVGNRAAKTSKVWWTKAKDEDNEHNFADWLASLHSPAFKCRAAAMNVGGAFADGAGGAITGGPSTWIAAGAVLRSDKHVRMPARRMQGWREAGPGRRNSLPACLPACLSFCPPVCLSVGVCDYERMYVCMYVIMYACMIMSV